MNKVYRILAAVAVLLGVAAAGYWFGARASHDANAPPASLQAERKPLYYRNPMGLPDISPTPRKDAMGMDYVPVYEGDEPASPTLVDIGIDKVQKLGVKSEAAALRVLGRTLRAAGRIEIDERRTYAVAPKFEGWVERLHVNTTGQSVVKGQPLFDVYSPELASAQREHALALQGVAALEEAGGEAQDGMRRLADASAARLRNWGVADAGRSRASGGRVLAFHAPVSGVVLEKIAVQGMRFMPGETLYRIADLSTVWVIAGVAEQDIARIEAGDAVRIGVDAYPGRRFDGTVDFVYPALDGATRTAQVRIALANPHGLLKPAMFVSVEFPAGKGGRVLTLPISAVIDSGARQVALVRLDEGRFEPRTVTLGMRGDDYVEVLSGVAEGEQVVTSANFLIDSESNLKAALSGLGAHAVHGGAASAPTGPGKEIATGKSAMGKSATGKNAVGHRAQGTLESVNLDGTVSVTHDPIPALEWPAMTMDFALANPSLAASVKPGSAIEFEIVERGEGVWVITRMSAKEASHAGHDH